MKRKRLASIALSSFAAVSIGCGKPPPSQFPTAGDALARMKASFSCANGMQAESKIDVFSPKGRVRGDLLFLAVNPDRVRFDVVSPFGATIYTLTSDGDRFEMLDVQNKQFLHGPSNACNLARLTQVPVPAHALVALLRGEAPVLIHDAAQASIAWDNGENAYRVVVKGKHEAREEILLGIRPEDFEKPWKDQRLRVLDINISQRDIPLYHAVLKNHALASTAPPRADPDGLEPDVPPSGGVCDIEMPRSIKIDVPHTEQDVILQYKKATWNPPLVQGAFQQPTPGGVHKQYVTCSEGGVAKAP